MSEKDSRCKKNTSKMLITRCDITQNVKPKITQRCETDKFIFAFEYTLRFHFFHT